MNIKLFFNKEDKYKIFQFGYEGKKYFDLLFKDQNNRFIYNLGDVYIVTFLYPKFLFNLFYYRSIKIAYFKTMFDILKIKKIITWLDNNGTFQQLDKKIKAIDFFAFQNGFRSHLCLTEKKIYHSNLFCFGQNDVDRYKKYGHNVKNFFPYGSLKLNLVIDKIKEKNEEIYKNNKTEKEIVIIDEISDDFIKYKNYEFSTLDSKRLTPMHRTKGTFKILEFTKKYCEEYKIIPKVLLRYSKNEQVKLEKLMKIYNKFFNKKIELIENDKYKFLSYRYGLESNLLVGLKSTLLCELFSAGKKIISFNYSNDPKFNFPTKNFYVYQGRPCYKVFKKKVSEIQMMPDKLWLSKTEQDRNYINKITNINEYKTIFQ